MKKLTLLFIFFACFANAQTRIRFSQMENPATSSVNLGTQMLGVRFLGTSDNSSITLKANNILTAVFDSLNNVGIGGRAYFNTSLRINKDAISSNNNYVSVYADPIIKNSITSSYSSFYSIPTITNTAFTCALLAHFDAVGISSPGFATITDQIGYYVPSNMTGATNNYGFYSNIASGSNRWNYYAGGTANNAFRGATAIGSITAPTKTLDVTGNAAISSSLTTNGIANTGSLTTSTTFSAGTTLYAGSTATLASTLQLGTNNAVLTGGNTGTVAVMENVLIPFVVGFSGGSPADATTYGLTSNNYLNASVFANGPERTVLPYNMKFIGYTYDWWCGSVTGSAETFTIALKANNTTTINLKTNVTVSSVTGRVSDFTFSNVFSANDDWAAFMLTPTWATNPTALRFKLTLYFVRNGL